MLLRSLGVPFTAEYVRISGGGFNEALQAQSPSCLVPILRTEAGELVWDSLAICEYLAERLPVGTVWPADATARTHARCITAEMHAGFNDVRSALPCNAKLRLQGLVQPLTPLAAAQVARIARMWTHARETFGMTAGPFLFGTWTAADAFYAPVVSRFVSE